jgi:hypothetical protein
MSNHATKQQIRDVLSGKIQIRNGEPIQSIARYLRSSQKADRISQSEQQIKNQEAARLIDFAKRNNLWIENFNTEKYISEGAEQKVYLMNSYYVFKLNDSIYFTSWLDYLNNLLLHNFFFEDTSYELLGFTSISNTLYSFVKQKYIQITEATNLRFVKQFLEANGFQNVRNHDYYNPDLGIILEDLHDENVLVNNGIYHFIDTVFYLAADFD